MNCAFVAAEAGEHTLEAIGEMMGITREGVRLIEVRASEKFRQEWERQAKSNDATLQEPTVAAGPGCVDTNQGVAEFAHKDHYVSPRHRRKLAKRSRRAARA